MSNHDIKRLILNYLSENKIMTIATENNNIPWASSVMFAYDDNLNLYFISDPNTRKIKNIFTNPKVAVAINEAKNKPGYTIGIQIEGKAIILDKKVNKFELEIFKKRHNWADKYLGGHDLFMIKPSKIIYLDDEKFGPQGKKELMLNGSSKA
jgi:uncharacterized protein YhbP (UPF0306 family)